MLNKNPRISIEGERNAAEFIRKISEIGIFDSFIYTAQQVLGKWYENNCIKYVSFNRDPKKRITRYYVNRKHAFVALSKEDNLIPLSNEIYQTPKRWHDTREITKLDLMLDALQHEDVAHAKFTFHIGKELIARAEKQNTNLAKVINKQLHAHLKPFFGVEEFGFWFSIEPTPEHEDVPTGRPLTPKQNAYHAHGIFYAPDEDYFVRNKSKRRDLMPILLRATKYDGSVPPQNWIELKVDPYINHGWISYCRKGRSQRFGPTAGYLQCPESIGKNVSSMSHSMTRRTKNFYERIRPIMTAIILDKFDEFSDDDWAKLNDGC